jgi:hypothetical protein
MTKGKKIEGANAKPQKPEPKKLYRSIAEIRRTFYPRSEIAHRGTAGPQSGHLQEELLGHSTQGHL